MNMTLTRLLAAVSAVAPVDGVAILDPATKQARIDYQPSATTAQKTAAQAAVSAFDWSAAADSAALAVAARAEASAVVSGQRIDALSRAVYALAQLVLDDRNLTADKVNAIGSALAVNGTTNAAIRTAVLAIPGGLVPKYTMQQFVDGITAKV